MISERKLMIKTVEYLGDKVRMIDQTRLPLEKVFIDCKTIEDVADAMKVSRITVYNYLNALHR